MKACRQGKRYVAWNGRTGGTVGGIKGGGIAKLYPTLQASMAGLFDWFHDAITDSLNTHWALIHRSDREQHLIDLKHGIRQGVLHWRPQDYAHSLGDGSYVIMQRIGSHLLNAQLWLQGIAWWGASSWSKGWNRNFHAVTWQSLPHNSSRAAAQSNYKCQWEDRVHDT